MEGAGKSRDVSIGMVLNAPQSRRDGIASASCVEGSIRPVAIGRVIKSVSICLQACSAQDAAQFTATIFPNLQLAVRPRSLV
jgi:hypothetical protein